MGEIWKHCGETIWRNLEIVNEGFWENLKNKIWMNGRIFGDFFFRKFWALKNTVGILENFRDFWNDFLDVF